MGNGQWAMANTSPIGKGDGQSAMRNRHYRLPIGHRPLPISNSPSTIAHYPIRHRLIAHYPIGHRPLPIARLAIGHCPLPDWPSAIADYAIGHRPLPISHQPLPISDCGCRLAIGNVFAIAHCRLAIADY